MRFTSLGSGSSGNATVVIGGNTTVMVDCGFGLRETEKRLQRVGVAPESIDAILVTHEHSDHVKGVAPFSRKYLTPVHMTTGTFASRDYGDLRHLHLIREYKPFSCKQINVIPVAVPHDAREPAQFVLENLQLKLGVLTDLGSITPHVINLFSSCDGLVVEANHDIDMLASGAYPPSLKSRVGGYWGHLNNNQTADLLNRVKSDSLQHLVVGHISKQNNTLDRARDALSEVLGRLKGCEVHFACQEEGFDWLELQTKNCVSV